jgi:TolC family type I secretion outer membrane protein
MMDRLNERRARGGMAAAALACAALLAGASAPAPAQTLQEALALAYQSNPTLLAERARLRQSDEQVARALSGWRPTITFSGDVGKAVDYQDPGLPRTGNRVQTSNNRDPRGVSVTATQPIWKGGQTESDVARSKNQVLSDRARLAATESTVLTQAATAYADVVQAQSVAELSANQERVLQRDLDAVQDRFRVGEVTRTDVAQAESRLAAARASRIQAEGQLASARAAYRRVIGEAPGTLAAPQPLSALPTSEEAAVGLARERNFDTQRTRYAELAAAEGVDQIGGELMPQLSASASYQQRYESLTNANSRDDAQISALMTMPLYDAGSVRARVREAKELTAQRRNEYLQAVRDAQQSATQQYEALVTARSQIESFNAQIRASEIALDGVRQEALVGSRTVLDVLNAEQELLNAQVSLVRAQHDAVVASYNLKAAIGELTAENLALPVEMYDPTRHYDKARNNWFGLSVGN